MDLGQMIKTNREKQNMSMNELARRAGIAQSGLSKIESGQRQPTFDLLERIIAVFNMSLVEFFSVDEPEYPSYVRNLIKSVEKLNPNQIYLLNQFIDSLNEPSAAGVNALCSDKHEPLAAHRSDGCLNNLPDAALDSVHEFQTAYLSEDTTPPPNLRGKKAKRKGPAQ